MQDPARREEREDRPPLPPPPLLGRHTPVPQVSPNPGGRAGAPLQSASISGAAPPGPSSFQRTRCFGRTQSLAATGPLLTFGFGSRSPRREGSRESRLRSRVPGAPESALWPRLLPSVPPDN